MRRSRAFSLGPWTPPLPSHLPHEPHRLVLAVAHGDVQLQRRIDRTLPGHASPTLRVNEEGSNKEDSPDNDDGQVERIDRVVCLHLETEFSAEVPDVTRRLTRELAVNGQQRPCHHLVPS